MTFSPRSRTFIAYASPLIAAIVLRCVVLINWLDSPLRFYHKVSGLDMNTLLIMGEISFKEGSFFNLYSLLIAAAISFTKGLHVPEFVIIFQLLTGSLMSIMTVYISLRIFGKRWMAATSGLVVALYAPEIMYETQILKETLFSFTCLAGLFFLLRATRKSSTQRCFISGIFLFLPPIIRVSGMLFSGLFSLLIIKRLLQKRRRLNPRLLLLTFSIGSFIAILPFINFVTNSQQIDGYKKYIEYCLQKGKEKDARSMNIEQGKAETSCESGKCPIMSYAEKFLKLFNSFEISNNLNYYFIKNKLFPIRFLPGPLLVIPLAITGLLLMLLMGRVSKREGMIFLYILALALPVVMFVPLARYRIALLPAFAMAFPYPVMCLLKTKKKSALLKNCAIFILYALILFWSIPSSLSLRAEDFITYAKALEAKDRNSKEALAYFQQAYMIDPSSRSVVINCSSALIQAGVFAEAEKILSDYLTKVPDCKKAAVNLAGLYNASGRAAKAEKLLSGFTQEGTVYFFQLGDSLRLQGKKAEAQKAYSKALETANKAQAIVISARLNLLKSSP